MLRMRARPRCTLSDLVSMVTGSAPAHSDVTGRSSSECEIHIDGNMFFWIAGVAGAGLAFLTFQAITMAGRRRRRDAEYEPGGGERVADMLWLGRNLGYGYLEPLSHTIIPPKSLHVIVAQRICQVCHMKDFSDSEKEFVRLPKQWPGG